MAAAVGKTPRGQASTPAPAPLITTGADQFEGFTDCPRCGNLALGATVLPCGHVTCANCAARLVEDHGPCPVCRVHVPPGVDSVEELGQELVMQDLVAQQLVTRSQRKCQVCDVRPAAVFCQACSQMYCSDCSARHGKMAVSRHHTQQPLPHLLQHNYSGDSPRGPASRAASVVSSTAPARAESRGSLASTRNVVNAPFTPRPEDSLALDLPQSEVASFTSGQNMVDLPPYSHRSKGVGEETSRRKKPTKQVTHRARHEWIQNQVRLLNESSTVVREVADSAEAFSVEAHSLAQDTKRQEAFLDQYVERLLSADVTKASDGQHYVSGMSRADVTARMRWEDVERRLVEMRRTGGHFNRVTSLQKRFSRLMITANKATKSSDPLTAHPRAVWETDAGRGRGQDVHTPFITGVLATRDGRLVMADAYNKMIKIAALLDPRIVTASLKLESEPGCMALLPGEQPVVAVTAKRKRVYLLDLTPALKVKATCTTARQYVGVAHFPLLRDALLVSCWRSDVMPASIDVIRYDGSLIKTITSGSSLTGLESPRQLCVMEGEMFVPDCDQNCVFRVELTTGGLVNVLRHKELRKPLQVVADDSHNIFIVSRDHQSVLVRSPAGEWRRLLQGGADGARDCSHPFALCRTESGIAVTWARLNHDGTVARCLVIGYDFI